LSKDRQSIIEILNQGKASEFWSILQRDIDRQIEEFRSQNTREKLKSLPADQYKLENEIMFAKIEFLESLQVLPENIMLEIGTPAIEDKEFDPYRKPGEFEK